MPGKLLVAVICFQAPVVTFPLKRKALLKAVGVDKFAPWEHVCDAALFENVASVGHSLDELAILLDQEDREVQFPLQLQDVLLDFSYNGRLDALRRLVEKQDVRVPDQRPPDRQHLLLTAA